MDRQEMLRYAETMPLLIPETMVQYEVRADRDWFYVKKGNSFGMVPMAELEHCCVEKEGFWHFRLTTKAGKHLEFTVKKEELVQKLFTLLDRFCPGFRTAPSTYTVHTWSCGMVDCCIDRNEVAADRTTLFGKKKPYQRIPMRSIVWVAQFAVMDDCGPSANYLRVYTADGKYHDLAGDSLEDCYQIALWLKDNNPDICYGLYGNEGFLFSKK